MTGGFGREAATFDPKIDFKQGSKLVISCLFKFYHGTTPTIVFRWICLVKFIVF
jgi:hypothetical protein